MSNDDVNQNPQTPGNPYAPNSQPGYPAGYPDPSVAPAYPGSPVPGDQQVTGYPAPYAGYGAPSAYAGPPRVPSGVGGLAIAALIVSIIAFFTGWVPFFGIIVAIVGLVLGIIAVRRPNGKGLSITAIILSSLAFLTGVVMLAVLFFVIPSAVDSIPDQDQGWPDPTQAPETSALAVDGQSIDTPCWSYEGPAAFVNNISQDSADACVGKLELWGEVDDSGDVIPTGVGAIYGQVSVEPIRQSTSNGFAEGTDPVAIVDAIKDSYFAPQGEIISLHEDATLGGMPADITRIDSDVEETQTKAFITVFAPQAYDLNGEPSQLFIISIVTPYENGDELIQQVLDSWEWK